jgi:two-component system, OmpR family, osmolarity sensor histidine kinase EnvZ
MAGLDEFNAFPRYRRSSIKRYLPRGLYGRAILIIVVPLVLLQVVSGIIFYDRHWDNVSRHRTNALAGEVALVIEMLREAPEGPRRANALSLVQRNLDMQISFTAEEILPNETYRPNGTLETTLSQALRQVTQRPAVIDTASNPNRVIMMLQMPDGVLRISVNSERLISSTTKIFVLWMVGTSLVLFAVAALFMRNQVSPLRRLAAAADSFGKGRDAPTFKPSGATEVRQAAAAFMNMRDRIRRQIQQRTEMLAGVSHDLRTPLTRMKLQLAMLDNTPEIKELQEDVATMEGMIEGYLNFARGEGSEQRLPVRIGQLLEDIAHEAARNDIAVALTVADDVELALARNAFKRCLTNLIDNAARFATEIAMHAQRVGSVLEITVDDNGPGIPEAQREDAFRPFFRIDESRNAETGGTGLGLTIARDIVLGHGGTLWLGESPAGGLRARIRVPI